MHHQDKTNAELQFELQQLQQAYDLLHAKYNRVLAELRQKELVSQISETNFRTITEQPYGG